MNRLFFILLFLVLSAAVKGQAPPNKAERSQDINLQKKNLYNLYYESVSVPNELINGKEYLPYFLYSKHNPLLFEGEMPNATLKINGREYRNTKLQYDTYLDEVVYTDTSRMVDNAYPRIALNKDIVDGFDVLFRGDSMIFRYLVFPGKEIDDGFFEIAYDGETRFIIRHKSSQYIYDAVKEYEYSPERYILAGGKFHEIKNSRAFLALLGEKSGEVKTYMKKSRIKFRTADKHDMIKVVSYYDSLKKINAGMK
jgi:hypothetical protein